MAPSAWNRQKVLESINGVRIEGPLPVSRLTAKAGKRKVTVAVPRASRAVRVR